MRYFGCGIGVVIGLASLSAPAWGQIQDTLYTFHGSFLNARVGAALDAAGDVDGDGVPDLVVGVADIGFGIYEGGLQVHSGKDGAILFAHANCDGPILAHHPVAGLGDVDGDGVPDVAIASPQSPYGFVEIVSGKTGNLLRFHQGAVLNEAFGTALAGVGDLDLDGRVDYCVTAPQTPLDALGPGQVRFFRGSSGETMGALHGGGSLGHSLAVLGDVTGDFVNDVAVGQPFDDIAGPDAGAIRVVSGSSLAVEHSVSGVAGFQRLGERIAGAGDVDGDGVPDLLAGSNDDEVRVFRMPNGEALHSLLAPASHAGFGSALAGGGDLDGDGHGHGDLLVGGRSSVASSPEPAGRVHIYSGADGSWRNSFHVDSVDSLAAIGDVDGDGALDVAIGSATESVEFTESGVVRVLSGRMCGSVYGEACPGGAGLAPSLTLLECPRVGGALSLAVGHAPGGALAYVRLGTSPAAIPLAGGCTGLVEGPLAWLFPVPMGGVGPGAGSAWFGGGLPLAAAELILYAQVFVPDGLAPGGFSASQAIRIEIDA